MKNILRMNEENGILTYEQTFTETNVPETDVLRMADIPGPRMGTPE